MMKWKAFQFIMSVLLLLLFSPVEALAQTSYGNNPAVGHYLSTRGVRLYYEVYGTGRPLLLIHGNGGSIDNFKYQIPYFSQKYRVIAVDSRAQGKSVDLCDSLSFEMMADDFNALLDSLHIPQCFVLGWSDGGINALVMAIRHPAKVEMLASTGANLAPDSTIFASGAYNQWMAEYLRLEKEPQTPLLKSQHKLMALDLFQPDLVPKDLERIRCSALIIGGDHDLILPSHTLAIAQAIPGANLWIVPDSGHSTLIQHQEQFNRLVDAFFSGSLSKE